MRHRKKGRGGVQWKKKPLEEKKKAKGKEAGQGRATVLRNSLKNELGEGRVLQTGATNASIRDRGGRVGRKCRKKASLSRRGRGDKKKKKNKN